MKIQKSLNTKEIGAKIKQLRKARHMRQDELGEVLGGLSRSQVSNLETGRRNFNIHQIKTVADFFGVSLEAIGIEINEIETQDLLQRARLIFENDNVPLNDKQELYEEVMKLYLLAKEKVKK